MACSEEPAQEEQQQDYFIEPLGEHDRAAFSCGCEPLDKYLKTQVNQDASRDAATPYALVETASGRLVGYYTLCNTGIDLSGIPKDVAKKLPRYPTVSATLLGRLAVDENYKGQGLGEHLLMDALHRSLRTSKEIASTAVVVDPINDKAKTFYEKYEFAPFGDDERMYLLMKRIKKLFAD